MKETQNFVLLYMFLSILKIIYKESIQYLTYLLPKKEWESTNVAEYN